MSAHDLISSLDLRPHPEGGYYRETYRAQVTVETDKGTRSASTAILYMLQGDDVSHLHRIDADEIWHFYEGQTLSIACLYPDGTTQIHDLNRGNPQLVVEAGVWFGAYLKSNRNYALVGCTVAPGFEFSGFELGQRSSLIEGWPDADVTIRRLTKDDQAG